MHTTTEIRRLGGSLKIGATPIAEMPHGKLSSAAITDDGFQLLLYCKYGTRVLYKVRKSLATKCIKSYYRTTVRVH